MKKRALSLLLILVMIVSMLPCRAIALTLGDGTAEEPYQIGSTVTNDGSDTLGMVLLGMVGIVGFCFTVFLLFVPRKKGKYVR